MGVGEAEEVGVAEGATVGDKEGTELATFTPLLQLSFLPVFMQVYLNPKIVTEAFALEQLEPALTAANEKGVEALINSAANTRAAKVRFTLKEYGKI